MKTSTPNQFFHEFLQISEKLTLAEMRMLYLLITQPEVIDLSQQEFAEKIQTHRRTINLGLKKLRACGYLADLEKSPVQKLDIWAKDIPKDDYIEAQKFIVGEVKAFYQFRNMRQIIHEDFYNHVIGRHHIHEKLRFKKEFITDTIMKSFPEYRFHSLLTKSDYASEIEFNVIDHFNNEIIRQRRVKRFSINKTELMNDLFELYFVLEADAMRIIKSNFHRIFINNQTIFISNNLNNPYRKSMPRKI